MSMNDFLFNSGRNEVKEEKKISFNEYMTLIKKKPYIAQSSVQRIYNMIMERGTKEVDGKTIYNFFEGVIFGADKQIESMMDYFKGASLGLDIKKRVLLLLGPPGGGKSLILSHIKKELGRYSRTDRGSIYTIEGCPINEEPLHLIHDRDRDQIEKTFGIKIEGKLCPMCQFNYENDWKRNLNNVPIKRIYIDEENRMGIGTFAPAEKNDMAELYGSVDLSMVDYYGDSGDVRAYRFNGELHVANRGIMEFIEVLKAKSDFLHVLLTLAEEQQFKTPRFPLQYVDETLIAHTNEGEFYRFIGEKENEAVVDRLYIVQVPYNMKIQNEEKIYHSALKSKLNAKGISIHDGAIRLASEFTVHTRHNEDPLRMGMTGISPRFILNLLAIAIVKSPTSTVIPETMLSIIRDKVYHYPVLELNVRNDYLTFLDNLKDNLPFYNDYKFKRNDEKGNNYKGVFDYIIGDE